MGRGQGSNDPGAAQQGQRPGQYQAPYGAQAGGGQWQQQPPPYGEPEYFGGGAGGAQPSGYGQPGNGQPGYGQQAGYGRQSDYGQQPYGQDPYHGQGRPSPGGDHPGHTQQFSLGEAPDAYGGGDPYGQDPYGQGPYGGQHDPYDGTPAPPPGPRLPWKQLLTGIVMRPAATFWQMRDHAVWAPALIVTFVYGLLAVFGFDKAREDVLNATLSNSIPWVLTTGVVVVLSGLILGAVTHTLARQLGGDGLWQPTVGLSMLIMSITDAPRLLFALFLGGDSLLVQVLGWATWLVAGYLFTSMVSKSHDIPWPKALGASAIQLIALLSIIKLGTL
ncbi:YIP1 family protein [Streptomyces sp. NPDC008001]|uniref:Yip1 family protein n=1 Tax=Streptomyces sp. NPDC008001 TaxID=3364804 RepID=UPI0036EB7347